MLYERCPLCQGAGWVYVEPYRTSRACVACKQVRVVETGATAAQLEAAVKRSEQARALLSAARRLWAERDARQEDQAACRRLYNAWLDLRDALGMLPPEVDGNDQDGAQMGEGEPRGNSPA